MRLARACRSTRLALTIAVLTSTGRTAHGQEHDRSGVYLETSALASMHKDAVGLRGTYAQDGYLNLGVALRLGASLRGFLVGAGVEAAGMIHTPGATSAELFFGRTLDVSAQTVVELTGSFGWHGFENVGSAGDHEVISENHVTLPFVGARVGVSPARPASSWQPGVFIQVRRDLGQGEVTSNRMGICGGSGFPDAPVCDSGSSTGYFQVGGFTYEVGLELKRIF